MQDYTHTESQTNFTVVFFFHFKFNIQVCNLKMCFLKIMLHTMIYISPQGCVYYHVQGISFIHFFFHFTKPNQKKTKVTEFHLIYDVESTIQYKKSSSTVSNTKSLKLRNLSVYMLLYYMTLHERNLEALKNKNTIAHIV